VDLLISECIIKIIHQNLALIASAFIGNIVVVQRRRQPISAVVSGI